MINKRRIHQFLETFAATKDRPRDFQIVVMLMIVTAVVLIIVCSIQLAGKG